MKTFVLRYCAAALLAASLLATHSWAQDRHGRHTPGMPMPTPTPAPVASPSPAPSPSPQATHQGMSGMEMPQGASPTPPPGAQATPSATPQSGSSSAGQSKTTLPNLSPQKDLPSPVDDEQHHTFVLADVLEFRPSREDSDFRWDIEGWHGGDYNRIWFKSEGERNTAFKADYDIDLQLLYGRFVRRYYDFQVGARIETQTFRGANVTRPQAVIGLEGLVPYNYEIESALFIDYKGRVSGRFTVTKDWLLTQRLILQSRAETSLAVQRVERFTTGRGLNNIEAGLRLRYEVRRKFAPYFGVSFDRSFFGTADLVRQDGGDPRQVRFVMGVRMWR